MVGCTHAKLGTHEPLPKITLCMQRVVCAATQGQVVCTGPATSRVRHDEMQFEKTALATALAIRAYEGTLTAISAVHLPNHRTWDVA